MVVPPLPPIKLIDFVVGNDNPAHVAEPDDTLMVSPDEALVIQVLTLELSAELVHVGDEPVQAAYDIVGNNKITRSIYLNIIIVGHSRMMMYLHVNDR